MSNWHEERHLETDHTRTWTVENELTTNEARHIYGTPVYDQNGDLRCRSCGAPVSRAMSANGNGFAACSDSGCCAHGFNFLEGSSLNNPSRTR